MRRCVHAVQRFTVGLWLAFCHRIEHLTDAGQVHCQRSFSGVHSMRSTQLTRKGFTLIELLIVVVIIGILAAIAIPKFANTKSKAYVTAMKSDLRNLVTAEEAFFSDSTYYTTATNLITRNTFKNSSGVGVPAVTTGPGYWSATVTHSQIQ